MITKAQVFIASKICELDNNQQESFLYELGQAAYTPAADQNPDLGVGVYTDQEEIKITDPYFGTHPEVLEFQCIADSDFAEFEDLQDFLLEVWIPQTYENLKRFLEEAEEDGIHVEGNCERDAKY